jgi:transketolase
MDLVKLGKKANQIRKDIIKMLVAAGSGHSAGPLGMADVFTALYFEIMNHDPKKPGWEDRDRLFLSCGHIAHWAKA